MDPEKGPNKRRRVDPAAILALPFRSPLRRIKRDGSSQDSSLKTVDLTDAAETVLNKSTAEPDETTKTTDHAPASNDTACVHLRYGDTTSSQPTAPPRPAPVDVEMNDTERQLRELESQADSLRYEEHTLRQARAIETKKKIDQLENLARKWRCVGQRAADEVFENSRERIARQGGFRAFRQRTKHALDRERYGDLEPEQIEELKKETAANGAVQEQTTEDDGDVSGSPACLWSESYS